MPQNYFIKKLSYFTLFIACIIMLMQVSQTKYMLGGLIWLALAWYYILALITWTITQSGLQKDNKTFTTRVYGAIGIRFIFSIFPLFIYLVFGPVREVPFVIGYILLYFLYTSFEIYFLVVTLRPDLKK